MKSKPKKRLGLREVLHLNRRIEELKNLQSMFYFKYKSKKINPVLERLEKKETWV